MTTIRDIAREAGVSTATVSRALRGLPHVDPGTLAHVRSVVERMDYVVSPSASRLKSGRSGTIAAITPSISGWYFATLLSGAEPVFHAAGLDFLLFGTGSARNASLTRSPRELRRKVDGLLALGLGTDQEESSSLRQLELPVVVLGHAAHDLSAVYVDDVYGAQTATQHLIDLGHERIGLIAGHRTPKAGPDRDRRSGFAHALAAAGITPEPRLMTIGRFTSADGESAMRQLLALDRPPTAVFAISDEMALGAIRAIRRAGLLPGQDVSIVGFDGHELAEVVDLTTVAQPVVRIGNEGARLLVDHIEHPEIPCRQVQFGTELVIRSSTGAPAHQPTSRRAKRSA